MAEIREMWRAIVDRALPPETVACMVAASDAGVSIEEIIRAGIEDR